MQYELKGGSFPVVVCQLADGEKMVTEKGSMVWMSPNMEMGTSGGGLGKMFSKAFSGESMFQNIYTAQGRGDDCLRLQLSRLYPASGYPARQRLYYAEAGLSGS